MNGHTFPIEAGADIASLHGPAIFAKAVEDDKDMKQAGNGISKDPGVKRSRHSHGFSACHRKGQSLTG